MAVIAIAPSEVAIAGRSAKCAKSSSSGTMIEPAADAEERAEEAGDDTDDGETEHRSYRMGVDALARLREAPDRAAILLDIDGTLAPIVERPEDAAVRTRRERCCAASSSATRSSARSPAGRAARPLRWCPSPACTSSATTGSSSHPTRTSGAAACASFRDGVAWPVEDKGLALVVSLPHASRPRSGARGARARRGRVREPTASAPGSGRWCSRCCRRSTSTRAPPSARSSRAPGCSGRCFAGDDTTDLDAFGAVDELEVGVKVAVDSAEAPPALRARADVVVPGTAGLVELLRTL